ncbi:MAG: PhoH family protein, partial [Terriglobia bacterium]
MSKTGEVRLVVPGEQRMVDLLGRQDELLKIIEKEFDSHILVRGNEITISGLEPETGTVASIFRELMKLISQGQALNPESVASAIRLFREDGVSASKVLAEPMLTYRGKSIRPKTLGQKRYIDAINTNILTFVIGPAGTGKTYLAMAHAVKALKERRVGRIILTRPAVEAGERLGFLPGDLYQKVDPYLRPLYDAVYDMMDSEQFRRFLDQGVIEIA